MARNVKRTRARLEQRPSCLHGKLRHPLERPHRLGSRIFTRLIVRAIAGVDFSLSAHGEPFREFHVVSRRVIRHGETPAFS